MIFRTERIEQLCCSLSYQQCQLLSDEAYCCAELFLTFSTNKTYWNRCDACCWTWSLSSALCE